MDETKCRLKQCNNFATKKCAKSLCRFSFCFDHATHKYFTCEYCPLDAKFATKEILMDKKLACDNCSEYLIKARCCEKCGIWMSPSWEEAYNHCSNCSSNCIMCRKVINSKAFICSKCDATQRACHTQGISGLYVQFK